MTGRAERLEIVGGRLREGETLEHLDVTGVSLFSCSTIQVPVDRERPRLAHLRLRRLKARQCGLDGAMLQDVVVDGFDHDMNSGFVNGCEFHQVVLRGNVGTLVIQPSLSLPDLDAGYLDHLARLDAEAPEEDWGLDISQAVGEIEIRGYASRRVRRDPDRQLVVTFEEALTGRWKQIDLGDSLFDLAIRQMLERGWLDTIVGLGSSKGRRYFDQMRALAALRDAGIAVP